MAFTERDRVAAEEALRRLLEYNDELYMRGIERLGQIGSTLSPGPPDKFWPTTAALTGWHQQQRRSLGAALGALRRLTKRHGANGANRYPMSEWGEPLALVSWMRRVPGRRAPLGMPAGERPMDGVPGEPCPNCPAGSMEMTTRASALGGKQVKKTFGRCRSCELVMDVSETWAGEEAEPVAVRVSDSARSAAWPAAGGNGARRASEPRQQEKRQESTTAAQANGGAGAPGVNGRPYYDESVKEWYRNVGKAVPMLVAGEDDMSDAARRKNEDCCACTNAPHSLEYHDKKIEVIAVEQSRPTQIGEAEWSPVRRLRDEAAGKET